MKARNFNKVYVVPDEKGPSFSLDGNMLAQGPVSLKLDPAFPRYQLRHTMIAEQATRLIWRVTVERGRLESKVHMVYWASWMILPRQATHVSMNLIGNAQGNAQEVGQDSKIGYTL